MKTLTINPQFVKDEAGKELGVFLTKSDFDKLLEELEDYEDIKAFDEAESRTDKEFIPYREAVAEIKKQRSK
jgi:Zn-finger nucleic acid-binding protein